MDPRRGTPVQGVLTVAVLAATGTEGDAMDDALFVMGPDASRPYLRRRPGVKALFLLPDGSGWRLVER
jgi:thiamine biosynthesis lipoprotein